MARIKYYYNTETCNYDKIVRSRWSVLVDILGYLIISFILACSITFLYHQHFDSPKEAELKQANKNLKLHYELLQQEMDKSNALLSTLQSMDNNLYRTLLGTEPISVTFLTAGVGGIPSHFSGSKDQLIEKVSQNLNQLQRKLHVQKKSYDELGRIAKQKESLLAAIPAIQPIANKDLNRLASGWGDRWHPILNVMKFHEGIDFTAPRGTPIYATGGGIVQTVSKSQTGYGNQVVINHGFGFLTRYAHMQGFEVAPGDKVKRGQCIGYVGNTGWSSGPHVHYEVIKDGKKVNPARYLMGGLTSKEYDIIIRLASIQNKSLD